MSDDMPPHDIQEEENMIEENAAQFAEDKKAMNPAGMEQAKQETLAEKEKKTDKPAAEPVLPDGIGMSVEAVRELLHKQNGTSVPADDPLLMQVTILNAFLAEQANLQKRHENALTGFMSQQTAAFSGAISKEVGKLSETLSGVTVKGIQEAAKGFTDDLSAMRTTLWLCTAIIACSALINVAVFVLRSVR